MRIVFHADDLGMNAAVDAGIFDCFQYGVLTSTSVLANGPTAASALNRLGDLNESRCSGGRPHFNSRAGLSALNLPFDIGVHLNLVQGRPLSDRDYPMALLDQQGRFLDLGPLFFKLLTTPRRYWYADVERELALQISWMLDHGVRPTHLNGHRYVELIPAIGEIVLSLARRFSINVVRVPRERNLSRTTWPTRGIAASSLAEVKRCFAQIFLRKARTAGMRYPDSFFGTAHAGAISLDALQRRLSTNSSERLLEVGVHPAQSAASAAPMAVDGWIDPLADQRPAERELLCSPAILELLKAKGIELGRLSMLN
jgi:predicted glycoside hydrolase/deacetylase ChbG (UPF0249 family)